MFENIIENAYAKVPLIHCITNYVTVNDVANILLACGGSPIMADDEKEVEEITSICTGLDINIGTLNERTISSMIKAGKRANQLGHLVVLDPVGAGASTLRTTTTFNLLDSVNFDIIRGNISEIKTVYAGSGTTKGVDADVSDAVNEDNLDEAIAFAQNLSKRTGAIIAITGKIDIVASADKAYIIRNGNAQMSRITGTGCMLTGVIAAYAAANKDNMLEATAAAVCAMGLCGEIAQKKVTDNNLGTSSLRTFIIDEMSKMNYETLKEGAKIEVR